VFRNLPSAQARQSRNAEFQQQKKESRLRDLQEKESQRQEQWMAQLGIDLSSAKKIVIAPRNDANS
jgi:sugar diacid utilization regulator